MRLSAPTTRPTATGRRGQSSRPAGRVRAAASPLARRSRPAWASTALRPVLTGPAVSTQVTWATGRAAYAPLPGPGGLVAVLAPDAVRVPMGIVVDASPPPVGTRIWWGAGTLAFGGAGWRPVRWWDPRPRVGAGLVDHRDALQRALRAEPADAFGLPMDQEVAAAAALATGDVRAAEAILGLGPGLTPSGDDVVAGCLAVLALLGRLPTALRESVLDRAADSTTALSAALVRAASHGQLIPEAALLLEAVSAGASQPRVDERARDLFAVGAHSGHDLAAGLLGALVGVS